MERKVIVIAGPTASGKTFLSLLLAAKLNSEIISADSRQIYKFLDIGTAKPAEEQLQKIKHHFIDELFPDEDFNASKFEEKSLTIIENLFSENKIPVVAGGSGLYIKALVDGITDSAETNEEIRIELNKKMEKCGKEFIYEELKKVDPESAAKMLPQNWKRVIRALEVFYTTGKPIHHHHNEFKRNSDIEFIQFGLNWPRELLYESIDKRVDEMISQGLVNEVKNVLSMGFEKNVNALNTVGYKEIISYLENEISLERAIELIKRNSRRYAKRQMTWFRADKRINWIEINSKEDLINARDLILKNIFC